MRLQISLYINDTPILLKNKQEAPSPENSSNEIKMIIENGNIHKSIILPLPLIRQICMQREQTSN